MYELMKKARSLSKEDKILFLESIENLLKLAETPRKEVVRNMELDLIKDVNQDGLVDEKKSKDKNKRRQSRNMDTKRNMDDGYIPKDYSHMKGKTDSDQYHTDFIASNKDKKVISAKIYDPETKDEICELISILDKHLSIDGDLSFDKVSVFLIPLLRGSKRVSLKDYKLVGLARRLCTCCRNYQRLDKKNSTYKEKHEIRREFSSLLKEIKKRIGFKADRGIKLAQKTDLENGVRENLINSISNLKTMGMNRDEVKKQVVLISSSLDYDVNDMIESVLDLVF